SLTHLVGRQLVPRSDQAGVRIAMINSWAMPVPLPLTPACRQSSAQYDFADPWQVSPVKRAVVAAAQDRLSVRSTPAGVRPLGAHAPFPRPLYCMRCRVTPNVDCGAVKIERTSSVS